MLFGCAFQGKRSPPNGVSTGQKNHLGSRITTGCANKMCPIVGSGSEQGASVLTRSSENWSVPGSLLVTKKVELEFGVRACNRVCENPAKRSYLSPSGLAPNGHHDAALWPRILFRNPDSHVLGAIRREGSGLRPIMWGSRRINRRFHSRCLSPQV